jgi:hypothetical protein
MKELLGGNLKPKEPCEEVGWDDSLSNWYG